MYYACFYAVSALLAGKELVSKTHNGTKQLFGLHFVKNGIMSESMGEFYSSVFSMRQKADYEDLIEYEKEDVAVLMSPAKDFIDAAEKALERL